MSSLTLDLEQAPPAEPTPFLDPASPGAGATAAPSATGEKPASEQSTESPPPPDPERPASSEVEFPPEKLILERDLNEAFLLMDFISGRQDVHIWDIGDIKYPVRADDPSQIGRASCRERV